MSSAPWTLPGLQVCLPYRFDRQPPTANPRHVCIPKHLCLVKAGVVSRRALTVSCVARSGARVGEVRHGDVLQAVDGHPVTGISPAGMCVCVCVCVCVLLLEQIQWRRDIQSLLHPARSSAAPARPYHINAPHAPLLPMLRTPLPPRAHHLPSTPHSRY